MNGKYRAVKGCIELLAVSWLTQNREFREIKEEVSSLISLQLYRL